MSDNLLLEYVVLWHCEIEVDKTKSKQTTF